MAFIEDLVFQAIPDTPMYQFQPEVRRIVKPDAACISIDRVKEVLRIPLEDTTQDFALRLFLKAATLKLEETTTAIIMKSKFRQVMSGAPRVVELLTYPLISVDSVKVIANETNDTPVLVISSTYGIASETIFSRSVWPTHRDYKSFIIEYYAGFGNNATSSDADILAAQESVPEDLVLAVALYTGHLYENREGQDLEGRFESMYIRYGSMPPMVAELIEPYIRRSL